jgi:hypothetical protein
MTLIQKRGITPQGVATALTVTLMPSLLFGGSSYALAGSEPGFVAVLRVAALGAPIGALLRRRVHL